MIAALLAVAGTLGGALLAGLMQERAARAQRAEARREERHRDRVRAITDLVVALTDHRGAMWVREERRIEGAEDYVAARTASHSTRAAITAPLATLAVLAPRLAETANAAAGAVYAMRGAADLDALGEARTAAVEAIERLLRAAGDELA
ncbi:protein kilB [Kitasatospora sp. NPDC004723]|uniref:protein kilB n=1 Tax=Kitasatospora sp. NPDC004723 TaxID=3154288 RepID=UPI0033B8DCD2